MKIRKEEEGVFDFSYLRFIYILKKRWGGEILRNGFKIRLFE